MRVETVFGVCSDVLRGERRGFGVRVDGVAGWVIVLRDEGRGLGERAEVSSYSYNYFILLLLLLYTAATTYTPTTISATTTQ